jgi:threonine dehydrogenase-like Zn-dependent dehydrogenase
MKALRFDGRSLSVDNVPKPSGDDEAVVRVTLSGICNTDLEIARGYAGFTGTLGHEFVGVVERSSKRPDVVGKRVIGEINAGCGTCELCRAGDTRHCHSRTVLGIVGRDGAHAEYLSLPPENLLVVPDDLSDEAAVFAEPLAAAHGITELVDIGPDTRVAVIGDGKLGLLCAFALALRTDNLTLVGKHEEKLALARHKGITAVLAGDLTPTKDVDVVVEASGSESGFATAVDLVRPRGMIVLKSTFQGQPTWPASRIVVDEITVVGSRCGRFAPALDLLASGAVSVLPLISEEFPLENGLEAMKRASEKGVMKVLLRP